MPSLSWLWLAEGSVIRGRMVCGKTSHRSTEVHPVRFRCAGGRLDDHDRNQLHSISRERSLGSYDADAPAKRAAPALKRARETDRA